MIYKTNNSKMLRYPLNTPAPPVETVLFTTLPWVSAARGSSVHMFAVEFTENATISSIEVFLQSAVNNNSNKFVLDIIDGDMTGKFNISDTTSFFIDDPSIIILQRKTDITGTINSTLKINFNSNINVNVGQNITFALYIENQMSSNPADLKYIGTDNIYVKDYQVVEYSGKMAIIAIMTGCHAINIYKI